MANSVRDQYCNFNRYGHQHAHGDEYRNRNPDRHHLRDPGAGYDFGRYRLDRLLHQLELDLRDHQ